MSMPQPAAGSPPTRPIGPVRSPVVVILLSIITFGIYNLYWAYVTGRDMKDYSGTGLGGGVSLVLAIFIYVVLMFTMPNEVAGLYQREGRQAPVSAIWGLWFLLPLIGWIIWIAKVQGALNDFWASHGATTS